MDTSNIVIKKPKSDISKTQKKKTTLSSAEKEKLWAVFDIENKSEEVECSMKEAGMCGMCNTGSLVITEEGFPTCSNASCGIIYKNTLDYSPEWRFYGSDDRNNTKDPTRCGNPINPLLVESSYGCKVICSAKSSYEMRKIRKWTEWQSMPHREKSLYDEFQFFHLDKTSATNGCSMAVNILHNIERSFDPSRQTTLVTTKPAAFIDRYCSRLSVNTELTMLSKFIAKKVDDQSIINDNTPHSIAAGIVYLIAQNCNLSINKTDIKLISGVSEVTINKCYKKLDAIKDKLIPVCILEKYA